MVWLPYRYHYIDSIPSPTYKSWGVEFSCVLERIASVTGAPWKKDEGSMVKTPLGYVSVFHTVGGIGTQRPMTKKPAANGMLNCLTP